MNSSQQPAASRWTKKSQSLLMIRSNPTVSQRKCCRRSNYSNIQELPSPMLCQLHARGSVLGHVLCIPLPTILLRFVDATRYGPYTADAGDAMPEGIFTLLLFLCRINDTLASDACANSLFIIQNVLSVYTLPPMVITSLLQLCSRILPAAGALTTRLQNNYRPLRYQSICID